MLEDAGPARAAHPEGGKRTRNQLTKSDPDKLAIMLNKGSLEDAGTGTGKDSCAGDKQGGSTSTGQPSE